MATEITPVELDEIAAVIRSTTDMSREYLDTVSIVVHFFDSNGDVLGEYDPTNEIFKVHG